MVLCATAAVSRASVLNSWLVLSESPYSYVPITGDNFDANDPGNGYSPFYVQLWVMVSSDPNLAGLNGQPESLANRGLSDIAWSVNAVNSQYPTAVKYKSITWLSGNETSDAPLGNGRTVMWANNALAMNAEVQYGMFAQGGSSVTPQIASPQSIIQAANGFAGSSPLDPAPAPWPDPNMDMNIGTPGSGVGTIPYPQSPVGQIYSGQNAPGTKTFTGDGMGAGTGAVELAYQTWKFDDADYAWSDLRLDAVPVDRRQQQRHAAPLGGGRRGGEFQPRELQFLYHQRHFQLLGRRHEPQWKRSGRGALGADHRQHQ